MSLRTPTYANWEISCKLNHRFDCYAHLSGYAPYFRHLATKPSSQSKTIHQHAKTPTNPNLSAATTKDKSKFASSKATVARLGPIHNSAQAVRSASITLVNRAPIHPASPIKDLATPKAHAFAAISTATDASNGLNTRRAQAAAMATSVTVAQTNASPIKDLATPKAHAFAAISTATAVLNGQTTRRAQAVATATCAENAKTPAPMAKNLATPKAHAFAAISTATDASNGQTTRHAQAVATATCAKPLRATNRRDTQAMPYSPPSRPTSSIK